VLFRRDVGDSLQAAAIHAPPNAQSCSWAVTKPVVVVLSGAYPRAQSGWAAPSCWDTEGRLVPPAAGAGWNVNGAADRPCPANGITDHMELGQLAASEPGLAIHQRGRLYDVCVYQGEQVVVGDSQPGCRVIGGRVWRFPVGLLGA